MPKARSREASLEFGFFSSLLLFYKQNRRQVRSRYKLPTKRFIDYCDPERNPRAFLRAPQFEALEIYIFLKEVLLNHHIQDVFQQWFERSGAFAGRGEGGFSLEQRQGDLFELITKQQYDAIFQRMRRNARAYPNYIFALTMGTGKTILMATCIFYEFILANEFPKDRRYCHNALVFAPDRTVLQSLREIQTFDLAKVVPPEHVEFLSANLRFHYLEEAGTALSTIDNSRFNIVVSNAQKIILKRRIAQPTVVDRLFSADGAQGASAALGDDAAPKDEVELTTNQRFEKLSRLGQLGIYVDEAHHAFGKPLAKDMGVGASEDTSLRTTIDRLASNLESAGTHVVACYNYTGTPYVGRDVLPEVVYAYGLREAIERGFLKRVRFHSYSNTKSDEFVRFAVSNFVKETNGLTPEGMLPKLAFFASTIDELTTELRPAVEAALTAAGISLSRILVNVGDDKLTSSDDIREFNHLDTPSSEKQFVLLVNKGREGWNCRSLFGVAMYREPRSKIFVLQASMRCLRSVGELQYTAQVYLSEQNQVILNNELDQNFRISAEELQDMASKRVRVEVRVNTPAPTVTIQRVRRSYAIKQRDPEPGLTFGLDKRDAPAWNALTAQYRVMHVAQEGIGAEARSRSSAQDLTHLRERRTFSEMTLVAEIARYLNANPRTIYGILEASREGLGDIVAAASEFNELVFDVIVPRLFNAMYELSRTEITEKYDVELVKNPPPPLHFYEVNADKDKVVYDTDPAATEYRQKSFHLSAYCFDSRPEQTLFWDLLRDGQVKRLYFTGMLTHGQSDFYIQYIDPESHALRSYYPDFIFQEEDGGYVIVEVKQDNLIDDPTVLAKKEFAQQLAVASGMRYEMIRASDAESRYYRMLLS